MMVLFWEIVFGPSLTEDSDSVVDARGVFVVADEKSIEGTDMSCRLL